MVDGLGTTKTGTPETQPEPGLGESTPPETSQLASHVSPPEADLPGLEQSASPDPCPSCDQPFDIPNPSCSAADWHGDGETP
jgi:hypothetical protein